MDTPVGRAAARLDEVAELPLDERPDAFHAVHTDLQAALAAIDSA